MNKENIELAKRQLMETINMLREEHQRNLAPYIKKLVELENITPRVYKIPVCYLCEDIPCTCTSEGWH